MKLNKPTGLAKLSTKLSSPRQAVAGNTASSVTSSGTSTSSWLTRGSENIASEVANIRVQAQKQYAPEFYLRSDESKTIRFRSSEPIAMFKQYNVRIGGKWQRITAPGVGERDLMREAGLNASHKIIYEVIDIDGYVSKKDNKAHRNVPRFYVVNMRIHDQLEAIRRLKGSLQNFNISVSRSGRGQSTTYTLLPLDKAPFPGIEKIPSIKKDFEKYYSPPSLEQQKAFMRNFDPAEQEREDS